MRSVKDALYISHMLYERRFMGKWLDKADCSFNMMGARFIGSSLYFTFEMNVANERARFQKLKTKCQWEMEVEDV